jgi:hypothetical protein
MPTPKVNSWLGWRIFTVNTNRGRRELLACRRRAPGGAIYKVGWPAWGGSGPPGSVFPPARSSPLCDFVPACSSSCTAQTLSSTPLLALLVLPLDALAFSHVHAPLLHLLHMPPWISYKAMLAAHTYLSFACGLHESCWEGIQWCIKVHAWFV